MAQNPLAGKIMGRRWPFAQRPNAVGVARSRESNRYGSLTRRRILGPLYTNFTIGQHSHGRQMSYRFDRDTADEVRFHRTRASLV